MKNKIFTFTNLFSLVIFMIIVVFCLALPNGFVSAETDNTTTLIDDSEIKREFPFIKDNAGSVVVLSINASSRNDKVIFEVDTSKGYVIVTPESNGQLNPENKKIMVQKDDTRYFYDLTPDKTRISLQLGSGNYEIALLRHSSGESYSIVDRKTVEIDLKSDVAPFLNSTWPVNWAYDSEASRHARTLVEELENDRQKVEAVYDFVVENIKYDFDKINSVSNSYVPDIDTVLDEKTGICYDYSALFAGMLRSLDIPVKLVKGYKDDLTEYHAWNEVYMEEKNEWIIIDTTYDAALRKSGRADEKIKDQSKYEMDKFY